MGTRYEARERQRHAHSCLLLWLDLFTVPAALPVCNGWCLIPHVDRVRNGVCGYRWLLLLKGALVPLTGLDAAASAMHGLALETSDAALTAAQSYLQLLQGPVNNIVLEASRVESRGKFASADWLSLLDVPVMSRSVTKGQRLQLRQAIDSWNSGGGAAAGGVASSAAAGGAARGPSAMALRDVEPGVLNRSPASGRGSAAGSPGSRSPAAPGSPDEGKPKAASVRSRSRISSVMSAMPWQRAEGGKGTPR